MWSPARDVLFDRKGNGLGIYRRMSGVVALGSLLVQVTHTESGPASVVCGQGHCTLGRRGGISLRNGLGIGGPGVFTCGSLQHVCHETIGLALEGWTRYRTCAKDRSIG